jgi:predicted GNAT superfamily acetyltransferase
VSAPDIVVRDIDGPAEMRLAEQLQKEVWGLPDIDVVPLTQLVAAKAAGGVVIGAFAESMLAGFAYGFAGIERGKLTHHSHMVAVRPEYRSQNIGHKLKLGQRERVLAQGIEWMTWTFDPLQSLNAYFNLAKLGVVSDRYFVNFYGKDAASFLHRNGTDRLWVTWALAGRAVDPSECSLADPDLECMVALVELAHDSSPLLADGDINAAGDEVSIEIPADINTLSQEKPELAAAWRSATRAAFTGAFAAGYVAIEFIRGRRAGKYILRRRTTSERSI